jgi:hypothetical protein
VRELAAALVRGRSGSWVRLRSWRRSRSWCFLGFAMSIFEFVAITTLGAHLRVTTALNAVREFAATLVRGRSGSWVRLRSRMRSWVIGRRHWMRSWMIRRRSRSWCLLGFAMSIFEFVAITTLGAHLRVTTALDAVRELAAALMRGRSRSWVRLRSWVIGRGHWVRSWMIRRRSRSWCLLGFAMSIFEFVAIFALGTHLRVATALHAVRELAAALRVRRRSGSWVRRWVRSWVIRRRHGLASSLF